MGLHVGGDLLPVGQRAERGAVELRAAVARDQHMRDEAVAIALQRFAQHLHLGGESIGRSDVAERAQPVDPRRSVGDGRSRSVRRTEQRLLAADGDGIAGEIVET